MASILPSTSTFTVGSLYLAAFAQARSPHIGLIIPKDEASGHLVHIRVQRDLSPNWIFQKRIEDIAGNMFLTSLLKIHDIANGAITSVQLEMVARDVPVPENDQFGECGPWVYRVIEELHKVGLVNVVDMQELSNEFDVFAAGNRSFARRDRFPNVDVSRWCS